MLFRCLEPLPALPTAAPTSLQGGSKAPLTFVRKVQTSGYGAVKPFRPSWASASAAKAGVEGPPSEAEAAQLGEPYPAQTPSLGRESLEFWGASAASSGAASRGTSLTATGRTAQASVGGARVLGAPLSCASLAAGSVSSLCLSSCGGALAVGGSEGLLSAVVGASRVGRVTRHDTCSAGAAGGGHHSLAWSSALYPGLVPRMVQASASASHKPRSSSAQGEGGSSPSRLLLGLVEGGAALWAGGAGGAATQPILAIRSTLGGDSAAASSRSPFPSPPTACALCYIDRLLVVSAGSRVYAYHFSVGCSEAEEEDVGAALRRQQARRYRCCASWQLEEEGVHVTALAAMNGQRSPYLLATCSDKSLRVWDLSAVGGGGSEGSSSSASASSSASSRGAAAAPPEVLRIPGAHSRGIHTLSLPLASTHAQCPAASLDSVLTASAEGGGLVRLWDLRSAKCGRQLSGAHVSRSMATGAALSPCATLVACGSEEKRAVVYDLRTEQCVERHAGASEAVTAVAWHPRQPMLMAGSTDGGVRVYTATE